MFRSILPKIKIIFWYLSRLIFLFKKMKQLPPIQKKPIYKEIPSEVKRKKSSFINKTINTKRNQKSLEYMTQEVMNYIIQSKQDYIDLKDLERSIKVPKRRIYDVINVFEGKTNII